MLVSMFLTEANAKVCDFISQADVHKIANLRVQTLWPILKTKSLQAIGHGMLSSRWISTGGDTTRRRRRKRERSRLFNIEICNRCSLPSAAHYGCCTILLRARESAEDISSDSSVP